MNKCFIIGRMVRDPEIRQGEKTVVKFTVAVDRKYDKDKADFISCVAFGKTADFIYNYFHKGSKIVIEGRWQTGSYENKEGQKVYTNDCVVESVEFGESKKVDKAEIAKDSADDFMNIGDECPFPDLPV